MTFSMEPIIGMVVANDVMKITTNLITKQSHFYFCNVRKQDKFYSIFV